jgi:hypothetical protein
MSTCSGEVVFTMYHQLAPFASIHHVNHVVERRGWRPVQKVTY